MSQQEVDVREQVAIMKKKYEDLQEVYVDLLYERDVLREENESLKDGKAEDTNDLVHRRASMDIAERDAEIENLKAAVKAKDETIGIQKAKFEADERDLKTVMESLKGELEKLKLRKEELEIHINQLGNVDERVEVRVETEVKRRINEEANKRHEVLQNAVKDMHRRMAAKDEEIRALNRRLDSTQNTPQNVPALNSEKEDEIRRLKDALKEREQQVKILESSAVASAKAARISNCNELSETTPIRNSSASSVTAEHLTAWQEQSEKEIYISVKLEEISQKLCDPHPKSGFKPGPKGMAFPKKRYFNNHLPRTRSEETKPSSEIQNRQANSVDKQQEKNCQNAGKCDVVPIKPQTIPAASFNAVLSKNIVDSSIVTKEGSGLLHILQEASKFQSPKPPGKVTCTTIIDKRIPLSGNQQRPPKGRGGQINMQRSKSFTASPQPKLNQFTKKPEARTVGNVKPSQNNIEKNPAEVHQERGEKTVHPQNSKSGRLENTLIQPPLNDVFVLTTATRKLNLISPPSPVVPRKFQQTALAAKEVAAVPIQQIYHGSSKIRIDGNEYSVCFVLTMMMKTANNWAVNNLRVCFPKLAKGGPLQSYGSCFMCLKFLDLVDEKGNPPRFLKTYEFLAQDGTCDSKDLFHLNCQKPTFVVEESNNFLIPVMRTNSSPDYPPPPIEIDLFVMTREKHPTNADTIEAKRKVLAEELRNLPHNECPKIVFSFHDGITEELGADPCFIGPYTPIFYALWQQSVCEGKSHHVSITKSDRETMKAFLHFCNGGKLSSNQEDLLKLTDFALSYFVPDLAQLCIETIFKLEQQAL